MESLQVETLSSRLKINQPKLEVIQLKSKKRSKKNLKNHDVNTFDEPQTKNDQFNIKKLQHEVIKFTNRFSANNCKAKEQLAIKLGAKPRRKECLNYKLLKNKLKQDLEIKKNQEKLIKLPKTMIRTSKTNKKLTTKKNKTSLDIIKNYGSIKKSKK
ncbi:uncharacterized protein C1orf131 [Daktulosphaira vitifoliae]|uniref:uncharacterized protein C1orf131 n=1 Tax=Daktulosphaira vitifoliae TaxID=58002 RepID=UPI0021AB01FE|nr:uncharacterized protein C1orf131 [Daktulosphaira vitifoliae]